MFMSIDTVRRATWVMRSTAATVLLSFNFVFIFSPTAVAVDAEINKYADDQAEIEQVLEATPAKKLAHRLQKLKENLTQKLPRAIAKREEEKNILDQALNFFLSDLPIESSEVSELEALKQQVTTAYQEAIQGFEAEAHVIEEKNLPEIAKQRHQAAIDKVKTQFNGMMAQLNILVTTEDENEQQKALDSLTNMLLSTQFKRGHTAEDPNKLPWRTPDANVRKPAQSKADLQANLGINPLENTLQLASLNFNPAMLKASLASFNLPTDADLQPTIDAPITPEIQALAEQLNHNVVEIYTWVHNNIRFIPSYGSIQGAQMTLEAKRGNAMDTASLTIALLRASNIPARYAYGTVEMPTEKVMNWVGGVNNASAAGNLLGQGGIPNTGIIMGGEVKYFQLEHVWVEAYVDFMPSRGIQNGQKDSWVPFDPSFKQYEFSQGFDLEKQVPFDAQALVDDIQATATINEDEGWVQNLPSQAIEQKLEEYQRALSDYIENQNPDATVGDVLGMQQVKILEPRPLAAGLPYNHIVTTQQFSEVPNNLRHRFKYELNTEANEYLASPFLSINEPTVKLAGKKLSLSFAPATQDDADIIESYLPEPDPQTGEINPEDIPDALPGYLINLKAEFAIGDQVVASARAGFMGTELYETLGYWDPRFGWDLSQNKPTAGEYQAIGLDLQGTSPEYAAKLQADLESTKAKLESADESQLADLTKQDLVGDMLEATIFSYFAMNNIQDDIAAQQAGIVNYRAPSYGKFSTSLSTSYWFGTPRNVAASGLSMDVDRVFSTTVDKNNNAHAWVNFNQMIGNRYSAMEHLVPEQMFSTEQAPAEGISAVKAIALADAQGQKIWTITQDNLDTALAAINLDSGTEVEIRNSVQAGRIVTTHEQSINFKGWVGEGYIIIDPATGAGAYKIAGGGNGSYLDYYEGISGKISFVLFVSGLLLALVSNPAGWIAASLIIIGLFHAFMNWMIADLYLSYNGCPEGYHTLLATMSALLAVLPRFLKGGIQTLINSYSSFLILGATKSGAGACKYRG
ncbi:MAG: transglutaminase domain-containing protein [Gammaproteobacteria bacterium]|nr:transglutaminase domain-containing protein [Gammaproteobacteria bacterium]